MTDITGWSQEIENAELDISVILKDLELETGIIVEAITLRRVENGFMKPEERAKSGDFLLVKIDVRETGNGR